MQCRTTRERTCIGCGSKASKKALLRIVRMPDGTVVADPSGRLAGRGAYICSAKCLEKALGARKLQRALKCGIDHEESDRIAQEALSAFSQVAGV